MVFLGDEGRDVLIVKRMIVDNKFTLLGPITSVGSMYMGPIYYYFMIPFLALFGLSPVGPAIMVALFAVATVFLIYYLLHKYFSFHAAIFASLLYALSPLTIHYGRSSWNPNLVPFFSTLIILGLLKTIIEKKPRWLFIIGPSFGVCLQLHYVSLLLLPVIIACLAIIKFKVNFKYYFASFIGFIISYSPFLVFEVRHQFTNTKAVINFLSQTRSVTTGIGNTYEVIIDVLVRLFWRLVVVTNAEITKIFMLCLFLFLSILFFKLKNKTNKLFLTVIFIWFIIGIVSFGIYKGIIYDYYFVPLFSIPFILTSIFLDKIWQMKKIGKIASISIFSLLIFFQIEGSPLKLPPNNLLKNTKDISQFVFDEVHGQKYNFALIATHNSDHAYRYFLEIWGNPPQVIENPDNDPERKTPTTQLYVVCEEKICKPLGHPLWEIAGFGPAVITNEWKVSTARIFRLEHYK